MTQKLAEQMSQPKEDSDIESRILEALAAYKWRDGYACRKCGHDRFCKGKKPFSRRCTKCKSEESATSHTIFHRCKIPLAEAVRLAEMVCEQPDVSSYEISRVFDKRQMTCWKFKTRITECLKDSEKARLLRLLIEELPEHTQAANT
ncbi:MAG: hypothetical protein K8F24_03820 [Bacteroidales bacterium]|nr:hypothetical protein [Bacteroidales bacterium]